MDIINLALAQVDGFPKNVVQQVFSRDDVAEMLKCDGYINLIIPRGGNNLVKFIKSNSVILYNFIYYKSINLFTVTHKLFSGTPAETLKQAVIMRRNKKTGHALCIQGKKC